VFDAGSAHRDLAGVRPLQTTEQLEERRLPAAARAHDRDELAASDGQVDAVDGADAGRAAGVVDPHDPAGVERGRRGRRCLFGAAA
jgi:hypothetical protein